MESEHPKRVYLAKTPLERHVAFFDQDGDGVIWPTETLVGCREIKYNILMSVIATCIIHIGLSYFTQKSILPDPFLRIYIKNIQSAKHGSDSESYDQEGNFDERRFNETFDKFTTAPHTSMTFMEGLMMVNRNRDPLDFFGSAANAFEWLATYLMLFPKDGKMKRQDVHDVFDGSIFYKISGKKMPSTKSGKAN